MGENGLILRTTNGGANWVSQISGTTADLHVVYFTDSNNGTAVGLIPDPYSGIILKTTNGGSTWKNHRYSIKATPFTMFVLPIQIMVGLLVLRVRSFGLQTEA